MANRFEAGMEVGGRVFATPWDVAKAEGLAFAQKVRLLQEWEYDQRLLMVASEENMPSPMTARASEILQMIHAVLAELGAEHSQNAGIGVKTGV